MTFTSRIDYLSSLAEAQENDYTFTVGISYSDPGPTPQKIETYRYISERIGTIGYIPYGSPIPLSLFEKVDESWVHTGPGYLEFQNQVVGPEELRRDIWEYHDRYMAYAILDQESVSFSSCPYVISSFTGTGSACFSPTTQVMHNILHLENETIWWNKPSGYSINLSRVAVDLLRAYIQPSHFGPNGIGGFVWVANRVASNQLFKVGLKDGKIYEVVTIPSLGAARGISIDAATGKVALGGESNDLWLIEHNLDYPSVPSTQRIVSYTPASVPRNYGMTPAANRKFYEQRSSGGVIEHDLSVIIDNPSAPIPTGVNIYPAVDLYGITTSQDGTIWTNVCGAHFVYGAAGPGTGKSHTWSGANTDGLCTDFYHLYPNTGTNRYQIFSGNYQGRSVHRVTFDMIANDFVPGSEVNYSGFFEGSTPHGVGCDASNNIWCVGLSTQNIYKIYRVDGSTTFPSGGECRYDSVKLEDFSGSVFNDSEIEWFLLRDPDFMSPAAQTSYYALLVDFVENETSSTPSFTRQYSGKTVAGYSAAEKIKNVLDWNRVFGSNPSNYVGRKVYPVYASANNTGIGTDKYKMFAPFSPAWSGIYMYSDFTGSVILSSITILKNMRRTEFEPQLSSSSSISSSSKSSISSSSVSSASMSSTSLSQSSSSQSSSSIEDHMYPIKNTTYLSTCFDENSIINPSVGWGANMGLIGYFDKSGPTIITKHIEKHGLVRNNLNKGTIFCQDAGKLFNMKAGGVSLVLSLPYDINNGIYEPLLNNTNCLIKDMLIWGVNVGESYITPPGIYAAFTPYGIEFTIWSSKGRCSITDTTTIIPKNTDFTMDFAWNRKGVLTNFDANMVLFCNDVLTAWGRSQIGNDNFSYLYKNVRKVKGANFCLMGNLFKKMGIDGTVRRIETYTTSSQKPPTSLSSSSSDQSYNVIRSRVSLPFSFTAVNENVVKLNDVSFHTVIRKNIDISSTKNYGEFINKNESDSGAFNINKTPNISMDLPPGFEEVYDLEQSVSSSSSSSLSSSESSQSSSLSSSP